jgi:hypothetical protein
MRGWECSAARVRHALIAQAGTDALGVPEHAGQGLCAGWEICVVLCAGGCAGAADCGQPAWMICARRYAFCWDIRSSSRARKSDAGPSANGNFTLTGKPKGQQQRIAKLELTGDSDRHDYRHSDAGSGWGGDTLSLSNEETECRVMPESAFHFTPPKGVPVVDALPPV